MGSLSRRQPNRGAALVAVLILLLIGLPFAFHSFSSASASIHSEMATAPSSQPPRDSVQALRQWMERRAASGKRVPGWVKGYEFWLQQRAFPGDRINWKAVQQAEVHARMMPRATRLGREGSTREAPNHRWEFLGPTNLGIPYQQFYGTGPLAGRISSLAFDQNRANVLWAAAGQGGVWKSTDFGQTWQCKSDSPLFTSQRIGTLTIDPNDSDVIYVGTGDFVWGNSSYGFGILKSPDGGETWTKLGGTTFDGTSIRKIRVLPEEPNSILVTTGRGPLAYNGQVYLSTDGGAGWNPVLTTRADWGDNVVSAQFGNGERFYYACGNGPNGGEVWRSGDRCRTWTQLNPPLSRNAMGNLVTQEALDLAVSPTEAGVVYLLSGTDRAIYRSTASGADGTWTNISAGFPNGTNNYNWSQHTYDWYITCSRNTDQQKDMILVGLIDLVASRDGGTTWESIGKTPTTGALTHNDQHCLAVDPRNPDHMLVGNDGGVYNLTMFQSIAHWEFSSLSANLPITQFYHAAYHPTDPARMLGGTQDNATPVQNGENSAWLGRGGGDGGFSAFDPLNGDIQYTNSQPGEVRNGMGAVVGRLFSFYRTTDNWRTVVDEVESDMVSDNIGFINPLAVDPSDPRYFYLAGTYLYRWDNMINQIRPLGGVNPLRLCGSSSFIRYIAVAPSNANVIYTGANDGAVAVSTDKGQSWRRIETGLPGRAVTSVSVHPSDPNDVLVSLSGTGVAHAWRCTNTAAPTPSWSSVAGSGITGLDNGDPVNSIARDASAPDKVWYVGSDTGVKFTFDGGANWYDGGSALGLPRVQVNNVTVVPGTGYLMAATWGRGIWRIKLSDAGGPGDVWEPDSGSGTPHLLSAPSARVHSLHTSFDQDWCKVDVQDDGRLLVFAERQSGPGSLRLRVYRYEPSTNIIHLVADTTDSSGSALFLDRVPAALYYIQVIEDGENASVGEYTLNVQVAPGDNYEPDDVLAERTVVNLPSSTEHTFHSADLGDWVRFTLATGGTLLMETYDLAGECDTVLELYDSEGSFLQEDDDGVTGTHASRIVLTAADAGTYYVRVRPFGTPRGSYKLRVETPVPTPPDDFNVRALDLTSAEISFSDSSHVETGYQVQRRKPAGDWLVVQDILALSGGGMSVIESGLTPGITYTYRILAFNNNGLAPSQTKSVTMPGGGPPTPPVVNAVAISDTAIYILMTDTSENETEFEAQVSKNGRQWTSLPRVEGRSGTGSTVFALAPGLTAETTYQIRARAINSQGGSSYRPSPPKKVKTLKKGKSVFNTQATLTITGPLDTDTVGTLRIPNPLNMPVQLIVPQLPAPFSASPTGSPYTLPAAGETFQVTFRPTSRTEVTKTWKITSSPPGAFTIKVKVVGKVR